MRCRSCGNDKNLKKITIKGLPKGLNAFICVRCWNIQIEATEEFKKALIKKYSDKEMKKAIDCIVKDAN